MSLQDQQKEYSPETLAAFEGAYSELTVTDPSELGRGVFEAVAFTYR